MSKCKEKGYWRFVDKAWIFQREGLDWYRNAELGERCCHNVRCPDAEKNGNCDSCDTIDGRYMEFVNLYASTCDGCMKLTRHDTMEMDGETQFGYCEKCAPKARKSGLLKTLYVEI